MKLVYRSEAGSGEGSGHNLVMYDFASGKESVLTQAGNDDTNPQWSPDGKSVAYVRNDKELHVVGVPLKEGVGGDRVVATGAMPGSAVTWSPDGQWIAYSVQDNRSFRNVNVVLAAGGETHPVSFLANGETASKIAWSPDGHYLLFDTAQRSEQVQIARVDLLPHVPKYREDEFRELFRPSKTPGTPSSPNAPATPAMPTPSTEEKPATPTTGAAADDAMKADEAKKKPEPVKIVFEGIRNRLTLLPLGLNAEAPVISADGKVLLFAARSANQLGLYTYSLDELSKEPAVARQLTSTPGRKTDYAFNPDAKDVFYLENGAVKSITVESRTPKTIAVTAS